MRFKKWFPLLLMLLLTACAPAVPMTTPTPELPAAMRTAAAAPTHAVAVPSQSESQAEATPRVSSSATSSASVAQNNPLTGLAMPDAALLERRPLIVKIQNVPRESRPQWGLSLADIVYEYYIEYGDTRFAAVFYGNRPNQVGPIRSARHIDIQLIRMYKAVFVFGGAYDNLMKLMWESDFGNRLIREGPNTAPALYRFEPDYRNYLMVDTTLLDEVIEKYGIDDERQDLAGMVFDEHPPAGGQDASRIYVRFSGGMYHYWDYEPDSGRYTRYSETQDDIDRKKEVYEMHSDQLTGEPLQADNVVILLAEYAQLPEEEAEVYNVDLVGSGKAYLIRDGQMLQANWLREKEEDVLHLVDEQGNALAFRPGQTWFEVLGSASQVEQAQDDVWRFNFIKP